MSDSPNENTAVQVSDKITDAGMGILESLLIRGAQAGCPPLAFPILSTIVKWAFDWLFGKLDTGTKNALAHAIIDKQTGEQGDAAKAAKAALVTAGQTGTPDELQKASDAFDAAYAKLIHTDKP